MMTEEEARTWIARRWGNAAVDLLARLVDMVVQENANQNLISVTTLPFIWSRHIVDSAQLLALAEGRPGLWVDVGTGAGFPGLVIAVLRPEPLALIEPRTRRAAFLEDVVRLMDLAHVRTYRSKVEQLTIGASIISARAVAKPEALFAITKSVAQPDTLFLLHGGREAQHALDESRRSWRGVFHVEQSVTDEASKIIVAREVRPA